MSDADRPDARDGAGLPAALRVQVVDGRVVAELPGRFDFSNSDDIGQVLLRAAGMVAGDADLVVDLSATTAVDAESARTLADLERRTRALGVRLRLVVPEGNAGVRQLGGGGRTAGGGGVDRLRGGAAIHGSRRAAFADAVDGG